MAGAVDLVVEQAFEDGTEERAAVVEVHGQPAALVGGRHLGLEDPRRVAPAVDL